MDDLEDDLNNRYDEDFEEEVTFFEYTIIHEIFVL